ncbi:hypothetical protein M427DRAFT_288108 [Gonapodya prolifera JEL478]|uniref:Uncharacterized protein n=1 Tax=Gonapodya prolifera (strain JEL478) TaxID=1344416 RepID=A0A139AII2_GONPJ|nr:hypothetical protein M427DRAFT_288108 [Gonapodya prolifera JEL478]|eukprot:KXS16597.1 hypothetical protein M427DRAFT_288108 [Gonapodya prolifera JEL478]
MSLAYVDGNPRSSKNPMTTSNGRTDFLYLMLKLVILIVWEFVDQDQCTCSGRQTRDPRDVPSHPHQGILHKQPMHNETLQYIRAGVWATATFPPQYHWVLHSSTTKPSFRSFFYARFCCLEHFSEPHSRGSFVSSSASECIEGFGCLG